MTITKKSKTCNYRLENAISIVKKKSNFIEKGSKSGHRIFLDPF
jgi:hypothetical protein